MVKIDRKNICSIIHYLKIILIGSGICFFINSTRAQDIHNFDFINRKIETVKNSEIVKHDSLSVSVVSETKLLGMGLIKFYQSFISSQDRPSCTFTLSCSRFGMEAVKQRGFFIGTLLTADRLTRCNDMARRYYKIDPSSQKAIDTVPIYEFGKNYR